MSNIANELKSYKINIKKIFGNQNYNDILINSNKSEKLENYYAAVFERKHFLENFEEINTDVIKKINNKILLKLIPHEVSLPEFDYYLLHDDKIFLFFKQNNYRSVKEFKNKNENEIKKIIKNIIDQINVLHRNNYVLLNLKTDFIFIKESNNNIYLLNILEAFNLDTEENFDELKIKYPLLHDNATNVNFLKSIDIWSVGIVALKLCLGKISCEVNENISNLFDHNVYSKELVEIISKCLNIDTKSRYRIEELEDLAYFQHIEMKKLIIRQRINAETINERIKKIMTSDDIELYLLTKGGSNQCVRKEVKIKKRRIHYASNIFCNVKVLNLQSKKKVMIEIYRSNIIRTLKLRKFSVFNNVNKLLLSENYITGVEMKIMSSSLKYLSNLEVLDLSYNRIGEEGMFYLSSNFIYITKLMDLNLRGNEIKDVGLKFMASNTLYIKNLRVLNLSWNLLTNDGMFYFSRMLKILLKINVLILSDNLLKPSGMELLSKNIYYLLNLRILDLNNNKIKSAGLKHFKDKIKFLSSLEILNLKYNEIEPIDGFSLIRNNRRVKIYYS